MKRTIRYITLIAAVLALAVSCGRKQEGASSTETSRSAPVAVASRPASEPAKAPEPAPVAKQEPQPAAAEAGPASVAQEESAPEAETPALAMPYDDLFQAARQASTADDIDAMLSGGADLSARGPHGVTPLMTAAQYNKNAQVVQALAGDVLHAKDERGMQALGYAARYNDNAGVLGALLDGATQDEKDTALLLASQYNTAEVVKALLDAGANAQVRTLRGTKALYLAASENQHPNVVKQLLSGNQNELDTALFYAASGNCPEVVKELLDAGAFVNQTDRSGATPLMYAARYNQNPEVLSTLIAAGADIDKVSLFGENALSNAAENDNIAMAQTLIESGADINSVQVNCRPVVLYAVESKLDNDVLSYLLEHGANVDATDWNGNTAFMIAASNDDYDRAKLLLEHGADVNAVNYRGETALAQAVRRGDADCVKALVEEAKADTSVRDRFGLTAGQVATRLGQKEIASYLGEKAPEPKPALARSQFSFRRSFSDDGYRVQVGVLMGDFDVSVTVTTKDGTGTIAYSGIDAALVDGYLAEESKLIEGLSYSDGETGSVLISYPGFGPLDDQIVADWLVEDALNQAF
ncbi:MAG: ankyrin repeat domain-containing protein [Sphaerochaetaceae bacterium]|nr:ankyrin repeat domain-containing protein [Spirochaetales bacterium]MDY5500163.1 ankyrin repeat domain-containing protein [Sphaerochaetaceae bacterium]